MDEGVGNNEYSQPDYEPAPWWAIASSLVVVVNFISAEEQWYKESGRGKHGPETATTSGFGLRFYTKMREKRLPFPWRHLGTDREACAERAILCFDLSLSTAIDPATSSTYLVGTQIF